MRGVWLVLAGCGLIATLVWLTSGAHAKNAGCWEVSARIVSTVTVIDCASPIGLCTAGTIDGNHGLRGETRFTATTSAPYPGEPASTLALTGTLEITTGKGNVTLADALLFDTAAGVTSSVERVTGGSGQFAGAVGTLFIGGAAQADGSFHGAVSGTLCTD